MPLKSFENPVNLPWINSQDFHGFLVHSDCSSKSFIEHLAIASASIFRFVSKLYCDTVLVR